MAGPRALAASHGAAAVLDFAVTQVLRDDPAPGALAAVLGPVLARLVSAFGLRAAIAFQPSATRPVTVLASHPCGAGDPGLLAALGRLPMTQRDSTAAGLRAVERPVRLGGRAGHALVTYSAPSAGDDLCALALVGLDPGWSDEIRSTAHAVAALVADRIRRTARAALADQAERLNGLIATAIPGMLISDERGRITHISRSFGAMFGIPEPGRLVGTAVAGLPRLIRREFKDPAEFTKRAVAMFLARRPDSGEQTTAADGRTIECDYWPVLAGGRYRGDIWLVWDMSDRTEIVAQAERENIQLRELDDARNQFVAMVSHELRTPLTSIVSFSELIRGEAEGLTPDGVKFLDIIERNADRLLRLIGDLLLLSRLEAGVLPLELAPVDVPRLIAEAVRLTAPTAASQRIRIDVTADDGPPVLGDHRRLIQVLDNLIGNAVKFSHLNGRVRIVAACDGQTWRIDVADSGIGIPPGEAARLFGRFIRASNAQTAGLPGTGLGLSIVKVITELHGGQVAVETALGQGTTFTVSLPVVAS